MRVGRVAHTKNVVARCGRLVYKGSSLGLGRYCGQASLDEAVGARSVLALFLLVASDSARRVFLCLTWRLAVPLAALLPEEGPNNPAFR